MGFEFQEDQTLQRRAPTVMKQQKGLAAFFVTQGWAKDARQANMVLLILAGVLFLFIIFSLSFGGGDRSRLIDNTDPTTGQLMEIPN